MGFVFFYCDVELIGQLLVEWKDESMFQECCMLGFFLVVGMDLEGILSFEVFFSIIVFDEQSFDIFRLEYRKNVSVICIQFFGFLELSLNDNLREVESNVDICYELVRECSKLSVIVIGFLVYDLVSYGFVWSDYFVVKLV